MINDKNKFIGLHVLPFVFFFLDADCMSRHTWISSALVMDYTSSVYKDKLCDYEQPKSN